MKILILTMSLGIGGAETHVLELSRALAADGHTVTVASHGGVFVDALTAAGVRHLEVPLHTKKTAAIRTAFRALTAHLAQNDYDVIHAHARIPGFLGHILARRFDIPFVTTCHLNFSTVWYWRMLTRTGERALAVSEDLKQYLTDNYRMPPEKIDVTVNGINLAAIDEAAADAPAVQAELAIPDGDHILTVTRLDRQCAAYVYRLIEAMPQIVSARPQARLIIVGGGDVLCEIRDLAAKTDEILGGGHIFVTGPRHDVSRILPLADVFVGVSRAAMEAMAARIPVVLTGHQGHLGVFTPVILPDAVSTNFCCRGRHTASSEDIARDVLAVLDTDRDTRRKMGEYNRTVIEESYSAARMARDAEEMYEKAIRAHVPRRGDVLISGYYGFSNAGDDALLAAIANGLKEQGIRKIAALSKRGVQPAEGVRSVDRFNVFAVHRAIRGAKLLISGGGSLLQDATSTRSLLYYASVIRFAGRVGVPVMIFANGIGPVRKPRSRKIAAAAVQAADYVSVRDEASRGELCALGIPEEKIRVTADPVYRVIRPAERPADTRRVVISLRELAGKSAADTTALEDTLTASLTAILRDRSLTAVLLPMQPQYDREICARVCGRLTEAGAEAVLSDARTPEEILTEIRGARAVLGMRLHALIFATASAVPAAAISYDPKIDALMDYLYLSDHTLSMDTPSAEAITEQLHRILAEDASADKRKQRAAALAALAEEDIAAAVGLYKGN